MGNLNLLVKFTTTRDAEMQVRCAARISVDGHGGLVVYDSATGRAERITLAELNSLRIDRPHLSQASSDWVN
jgi:hypothetical protein